MQSNPINRCAGAGAAWPVILSGAKNLDARLVCQILRSAQDGFSIRSPAASSQSAKIATSLCHRWSITSSVQGASLVVAGRTHELRRSSAIARTGGLSLVAKAARSARTPRQWRCGVVDSSQGGDSSPGRPCADRAVVVLAALAFFSPGLRPGVASRLIPP